MNLVQRIISILLNAGHASKLGFIHSLQSVLCYRRLQKILLCTSHHTTIKSLNSLGEKHDSAVHEWRSEIEKTMVCYSLVTRYIELPMHIEVWFQSL